MAQESHLQSTIQLSASYLQNGRLEIRDAHSLKQTTFSVRFFSWIHCIFLKVLPVAFDFLRVLPEAVWLAWVYMRSAWLSYFLPQTFVVVYLLFLSIKTPLADLLIFLFFFLRWGFEPSSVAAIALSRFRRRLDVWRVAGLTSVLSGSGSFSITLLKKLSYKFCE